MTTLLDYTPINPTDIFTPAQLDANFQAIAKTVNWIDDNGREMAEVIMGMSKRISQLEKQVKAKPGLFQVALVVAGGTYIGVGVALKARENRAKIYQAAEKMKRAKDEAAETIKTTAERL
jgi:arginyl-tRNA synthetase